MMGIISLLILTPDAVIGIHTIHPNRIVQFVHCSAHHHLFGPIFSAHEDAYDLSLILFCDRRCNCIILSSHGTNVERYVIHVAVLRIGDLPQIAKYGSIETPLKRLIERVRLTTIPMNRAATKLTDIKRWEQF